MPTDNQDIAEAFDELWYGDKPRFVAEYGIAKWAFKAGVAYGVAKREAVERAANADLSDAALSECIARSTVGERIADDAGKVDVTG